MKRVLTIILLAFLSLGAFARGLDELIPRPDSILVQKGSFRVSGAAMRCDPGFEKPAIEAVKRFASRVSLVCGKSCPFSSPVGLASVVNDGSVKGVVFLKDASLAAGAYRIDVASKSCVVRASDCEGVSNALATLKQLLPEEVYGIGNGSDKKWVIPACVIKDAPENVRRGLCVDCASEYRTVEELKSLFVEMSKYKINTVSLVLSAKKCWRVKGQAGSDLAKVSAYFEGGEKIYDAEQLKDLAKTALSLGLSIEPCLVVPSELLAYLNLDKLPSDAVSEVEELLGAGVRFAGDASEFGVDIDNVDIKSLAQTLWGGKGE